MIESTNFMNIIIANSNLSTLTKRWGFYIYLKISHMKLTESEKKEILKLYLKEDVDFNSIMNSENAGPCFQKIAPDFKKLVGALMELIKVFPTVANGIGDLTANIQPSKENVLLVNKSNNLIDQIGKIQNEQMPIIMSALQNIQKY